MMESSVYQETPALRLSKLLLALDEIAHTYYLSGHLEQALLVYRTGMALLDLPEVEQRDRANFLLRHGNMLAVKTLFEQEMNIKKALIYAFFTSGSICQKRQEYRQARGAFEQAYNVARSISLQHAMQQILRALHQTPAL